MGLLEGAFPDVGLVRRDGSRGRDGGACMEGASGSEPVRAVDLRG